MDDIFLNENSPNNRTKIVASNFNTTSFLNNAQNLLKDQGESNNKFQDYLKNRDENSFFLKEMEPDEIYKLYTSESKYKKAVLPYGISSQGFKSKQFYYCLFLKED